MSNSKANMGQINEAGNPRAASFDMLDLIHYPDVYPACLKVCLLNTTTSGNLGVVLEVRV